MNIKKQKPLDKGAGVLLPVASLPSNYGIGTFGKAALDFIDFLYKAGLKYWQVLPLGPTGYGDSPYQSFSAFAGNPYFIDLDYLIEEGLLKAEDVSAIQWFEDESYIDYEKIYLNRFNVLKKAYSNSLYKYMEEIEYKDFCEKNSFWLEDYALFMAVKESFDNLEQLKWPDDIRLRDPETVEKYRERLKAEIGFWKFTQYKFTVQWEILRKYAGQNGVSIIGDIPMYVAMDSADTWVNFKEFQMDENHRPTRVAGVPPDRFSKTGQFWGNPLFNWEYMVKNDFSWWRNRMRHSAKLYHIIRIDHFIGIARYYSIPIGEESAVNGIYRQGPGIALLKAINEEIGDSKIIAEDLGVVTKDVKEILKKTGYPGMKILIFAFDGKSDNPNLPVHLKKNSVIYGGTHDNDTLRGFVSSCDEEVSVCIRKYFEVKENEEMVKKIMEAGFNSRANVAIFQMQDYLMLGNETKTNTPSTLGDNWKWRLGKGQASSELSGIIRNMKKER